jgi:HD-GYP domain-containing protein (c-di-GMP phosphodiesterase class II)
MTAARVYRKALEDYSYAFNEIRKGAGSQFCPECSEAFLKVFSSNTLRIRNLNKKNVKITL